MSKPIASAPFTLERRFHAPRELVFAALTQPEHLSRWMSPPGMTMSTCFVDLRVGGVFHYDMRLPDGQVWWGLWTFREIVAPERLVVSVQFSDAQRGLAQHPMAPGWPARTLSTTTLTEADGITTLHLDFRPLETTEAGQALFDAAHPSMSMGWNGTMDKLQTHLASIQPAQVALVEPGRIETTRCFAAPRELLWRAFTESGHVEHWWGPQGFSTQTIEHDVREGGLWRHTMRGPDGKVWPNRIRYTTVRAPELLEWAHDDDGASGGSEPWFHVTVRLDEVPGGTRVSLVHRFASSAARDANIAISGAIQGAKDTMERLSRHLPTMS